MKLFSTCEGCRKRKILISKRKYNHRHAGKITSQSMLCRDCYKDIKAKLAPDLV